MITKFFRGSTLSGCLICFGIAVLVVAADSTPAFAVTSPATCVPTDIGYSATGMAVVCGGNTYAAWQTTPPSGCGTTGIDAIKIWTSLEQAALLSGKNIKITFTTCSGSYGITQVDLVQ